MFRDISGQGHTMALKSTDPLTEMSTRNVSWGGGGKSGRCVGLKNLPPLCADCLEILGASTSWRPKGLFRPVMEEIFLYIGQREGVTAERNCCTWL